MLKWFSGLSIQVQAALIGATVTLLGILVRDLVFRLWHERWQRRKSQFEIFRRYADPLISSASSLLWRLYEFFYIKGRCDYLKNPMREFEKYKKISTLYRIARLLGWICAYRRELSFLEVSKKKQLDSINKAIESLEAALADGPHIELEKLKGIASLWDIKLPNKKQEISAIAIALNNIIMRKLEAGKVSLATKLQKVEQQELCNCIGSA